jgi:hypothetical protein
VVLNLSFDATENRNTFYHSFHRYHNHLLKPGLFASPSCRLCGEEKEETSHLFAFCPGLSSIRMRIIGTPVLEEHFKWNPSQLLAMIKEIDKICPEEGMAEAHRHRTPGVDM